MATPVASFCCASRWLLLVLVWAALSAGCSGGSTETVSDGSPVGSAPPAGSPDPVPATDTIVSLTWQPNTDPVAGYIVYYGPTAEAATTLAVQLALQADPFDGGPPSVAFNAGRDLSLNHGDTVCFRLRAYNAANVLSDWSAAACGTI